MKMTPIVIAGHWATGSRLLCEVFEACGMWLGDEESGWYRTTGMDHPKLNTFGNELDLDLAEPTSEDIAEVLRKFKAQAIRYEKPIFGFKCSHILQNLCWGPFKDALEAEWPDAIYVFSDRHINGIVGSSMISPVWAGKQADVRRSVNSMAEAIKWIKKNKKNYRVLYPDDYETGMVKGVIDAIKGLAWTQAASDLYIPVRVDAFSEEEVQK